MNTLNDTASTSLSKPSPTSRARRAGAFALVAVLVAGAGVVSHNAAASAASTTRANPTSVCAARYVVRPNDAWSTIARKNGVSMANLLKANRATTKTVIHPGKKLCVPAVCSTYKVVFNDGWTIIARKKKANLTNLLKANTASLRTVIFPGQKLCIPVRAKASKPPATTKPAPTTTKPKPTTTTKPKPTTTKSENEIQRIIRDVWPNNLEEKALVIAWRESNYNPRAKNYCCYGLFQMYWEVHKGWMKNFGVTRAEQLFDPTINAKMAYQLYLRAGGWGPWSQTAY